MCVSGEPGCPSISLLPPCVFTFYPHVLLNHRELRYPLPYVGLRHFEHSSVWVEGLLVQKSLSYAFIESFRLIDRMHFPLLCNHQQNCWMCVSCRARLFWEFPVIFLLPFYTSALLLREKKAYHHPSPMRNPTTWYLHTFHLYRSYEVRYWPSAWSQSSPKIEPPLILDS